MLVYSLIPFKKGSFEAGLKAESILRPIMLLRYSP